MALLNFVKGLISEKEGVKEYREALGRVLSDAKITDVEKAELENIAQKHGLTTDELAKLQRAAVSNAYTSIATDQKITEEEKETLEALRWTPKIRHCSNRSIYNYPINISVVWVENKVSQQT